MSLFGGGTSVTGGPTAGRRWCWPHQGWPPLRSGHWSLGSLAWSWQGVLGNAGVNVEHIYSYEHHTTSVFIHRVVYKLVLWQFRCKLTELGIVDRIFIWKKMISQRFVTIFLVLQMQWMQLFIFLNSISVKYAALARIKVAQARKSTKKGKN